MQSNQQNDKALEPFKQKNIDDPEKMIKRRNYLRLYVETTEKKINGFVKMSDPDNPQELINKLQEIFKQLKEYEKELTVLNSNLDEDKDSFLKSIECEIKIFELYNRIQKEQHNAKSSKENGKQIFDQNMGNMEKMEKLFQCPTIQSDPELRAKLIDHLYLIGLEFLENPECKMKNNKNERLEEPKNSLDSYTLLEKIKNLKTPANFNDNDIIQPKGIDWKSMNQKENESNTSKEDIRYKGENSTIQHGSFNKKFQSKKKENNVNRNSNNQEISNFHNQRQEHPKQKNFVPSIQNHQSGTVPRKSCLFCFEFGHQPEYCLKYRTYQQRKERALQLKCCPKCFSKNRHEERECKSSLQCQYEDCPTPNGHHIIVCKTLLATL